MSLPAYVEIWNMCEVWREREKGVTVIRGGKNFARNY